MAGKKKNTEVVSLQKYKRKGHLNIGTILFGIIFVYLVFTVLIYFTKDRVSVYEVREGSILKDRNLTGMVLRKETVVNAEKSGYVNYFVDDAQKVALGTNIYTITSSKLETQTDQDSNEEVSLNADESMMKKGASIIEVRIHLNFRPIVRDYPIMTISSKSMHFILHSIEFSPAFDGNSTTKLQYSR